MAISIDWSERIIYVPREDLTLVQSSPTEIRELNLNWFRLQLKDLEDNDAGMVNPDTHRHNTEVTLGGLTYARVIEIINGYTITFEDGQYAVNLVGANSNVGDVVNVNQVSVRSSNSAGMTSSPAIEYSTYQNGVWVSETKGVSGTVFPIGTPMRYVNNLADAKLIADYRGFNRIYIVDDMTLDTSHDFQGFVFQGQTHINNAIFIEDIANVQNAVFSELTVSGVLDGGNDLRNCIVKNIAYVNGHIHNSSLAGNIYLAGGEDAFILSCTQMDTNILPVIDLGGSGQDMSLHNYSGNVNIQNLNSSTNFVSIGLNAGKVILDSTTVLQGVVHISGVGELVDENDVPIITGTWNSNVTVINTLVNRENIANGVWDSDKTQFDEDNTFGKSLNDIELITKAK